MAVMLAGVWPSIIFASSPTASTRLRPLCWAMATTGGSFNNDATALDVYQRIRRAQVDGHIGRQHAQESAQHYRPRGGARWVRQSAWNASTASLDSASFLRLPKVLQWFSGNIGFHRIHHLNPRAELPAAAMP